MNKIITIDIMTKDLPNFISKEANPEDGFGWIKCEVKLTEENTWEGKVISISSNGKYKVELTKKLGT